MYYRPHDGYFLIRRVLHTSSAWLQGLQLLVSRNLVKRCASLTLQVWNDIKDISNVLQLWRGIGITFWEWNKERTNIWERSLREHVNISTAHVRNFFLQADSRKQYKQNYYTSAVTTAVHVCIHSGNIINKDRPSLSFSLSLSACSAAVFKSRALPRWKRDGNVTTSSPVRSQLWLLRSKKEEEQKRGSYSEMWNFHQIQS